eukprot:SAG22_NODE_242_length_14104_cov_13.581935_5_plen_85_part_00
MWSRTQTGNLSGNIRSAKVPCCNPGPHTGAEPVERAGFDHLRQHQLDVKQLHRFQDQLAVLAEEHSPVDRRLLGVEPEGVQPDS